jgi:hypothetical protein
LSNLVRHGLDLRCHCVGGCFCAVLDVGGLLFLGNRCLRDSRDVLLQFVSGVSFSYLIRTFEVVLAGCAAAVLPVDFVVPDEPFEVQLCFVKIILDGDGLVFSLCHFFFVEVVGCIHLLEVEL